MNENNSFEELMRKVERHFSDSIMQEEHDFDDIEVVDNVDELEKSKPVHYSWRFICFPDKENDRIIQVKIPKSKGYFNLVVPEDAASIGMYDIKAGEKVHIIADDNQSPKTNARIICPERVYEAFEKVFSSVEAIYRLETLAAMTPAQQKYIIPVVLDGDDRREKQFFVDRLYDLDSMRNKYDLIKHTLFPVQRNRIDELFRQLEGVSDYMLRQKPPIAFQQLKLILNINSTCPTYKEADYETILAKLNKAIYGQDKANKIVAERIVGAKYKKWRKGIKILVIGRPGTGKTMYSKVVSDVCGFPFAEVQFAGLNDPMEITGDDPSYDKATEGLFIDLFFYCGTEHCVFLLDEIDKCGTKHGDSYPMDVLVDALGDKAVFHDRFTEYDFSTENTIFIATANSKSVIPDHILNRFDEVIVLDEYTSDDRLTIARDYIIPELRNGWKVDVSGLEITDATLKYIESQYCSDDGMRMMKSFLERIFDHYVGKSGGKPVQHVVDESDIVALLGEPDIKNDSDMRYKNNNERYPDAVHEELIAIRNELCVPKIDTSQKNMLLKRYDILSKMVLPKAVEISPDSCSHIRECLDKSHYKLDNVKEEIERSVYDAALRHKSISGVKLLLVGPPGVGKTSIARSVAKGLNEPLIEIPCGSITHPADLLGASTSIKDATCGLIIREMDKKNTTHGVLMLNELDKLRNYDGMSMSTALVDLLDSIPTFTDNLLGVPVDMSGFMVIASANDLSQIEPWILDRFKIIHIEGYSEKEKLTILDKYVIPRLVSDYIYSGIKIKLTAEARRAIIQEYCLSSGVRDLEMAAESVVKQTLFRKRGQQDVVVCISDVRKALGQPCATLDQCPKTPVLGLTRALAVTGSTGCSFGIETEMLPGDNCTETIITGLAEQVISESVQIAKTYVRAHYTQGKNFGMHLSFLNAAVKKDGPSAGVAILMSILSALNGVAIPTDVAYTGEIDLKGNITAVGGVKAKLDAAQRAGCKVVYIPKANFCDLDREFLDELKKANLQVRPVEHVSQVIQDLLKNNEIRKHAISGSD